MPLEDGFARMEGLGIYDQVPSHEEPCMTHHSILRLTLLLSLPIIASHAMTGDMPASLMPVPENITMSGEMFRIDSSFTIVIDGSTN